MATTPICNPHICRVLLGTVRFFGVLWGAVGYWNLLGYAGGRGHRGLLQGTMGYWGYFGVIVGTDGYFGVLGVLWGTLNPSTEYL